MKTSNDFMLHYIVFEAANYRETDVTSVAKLFAIDGTRLQLWAEAQGFAYDHNCLMGYAFPAIWQAFAGESKICRVMNQTLETILERVKPGSTFDEWMEECRREEAEAAERARSLQSLQQLRIKQTQQKVTV